MLAAFKANNAKRGGAASFSQVHKATGRIASKSPCGLHRADGVSKQEPPQLGSMNTLLAQPSWATHLQRKIAVVTEPEEQHLLHQAMLEFSMDNANYTTDFLQPQECRFVPDPILCSIGRCSCVCHHEMKDNCKLFFYSCLTDFMAHTPGRSSEYWVSTNQPSRLTLRALGKDLPSPLPQQAFHMVTAHFASFSRKSPT
jgi:hypothetical protein